MGQRAGSRRLPSSLSWCSHAFSALRLMSVRGKKNNIFGACPRRMQLRVPVLLALAGSLCVAGGHLRDRAAWARACESTRAARGHGRFAQARFVLASEAGTVCNTQHMARRSAGCRCCLDHRHHGRLRSLSAWLVKGSGFGV